MVTGFGMRFSPTCVSWVGVCVFVGFGGSYLCKQTLFVVVLDPFFPPVVPHISLKPQHPMFGYALCMEAREEPKTTVNFLNQRHTHTEY